MKEILESIDNLLNVYISQMKIENVVSPAIYDRKLMYNGEQMLYYNAPTDEEAKYWLKKKIAQQFIEFIEPKMFPHTP